MHKIEPGSIIEIELPNGRFAYGCVFDNAIVGIYKVITSGRLRINDIILNCIEIYIALNESFITKGIFPIIGKITLINDSIYAPDLAWYAEWLPDDSVKRSAIRNKQGKTEYTNEEYYISLVKKGLIINVFNKPDNIASWIMDNLNKWPNYEMPTE